jgi:ribosomal protein S18 acetylase RimI-like enzyme
MTSTTATDVVPITPDHVEGYHRALDKVASERKYLALLEAFPLPQTRDFVLSLIEKGDPMFVALADGDVVGWCDIRRLPFPAHADRGTLGIGIVSEYRGHGLGYRLIDAALKQAFRAGFARVELDVRIDNLPAVRLYEKFGFVRGCHSRCGFRGRRIHDAIAMAIVSRPCRCRHGAPA